MSDPRPVDERTQEALRHLQRATLELIDAARAALDLAEDAVREPGGLVRIVAETVAGVSQAAGDLRGRRRGEGAGSAATPSDAPGGGAARSRPGVEHITIG
jgi:hypothetical protein